MQNSPTWLPVVAALLTDHRGHVLLQKRPLSKPHGGLWEFPGGKVEIHENPRLALVRELDEELSLTVDPANLEPIAFADNLPETQVVLFLYKIADWEGVPMPMEGADVTWSDVSGLHGFAMPPLDVQLRHHLTK